MREAQIAFDRPIRAWDGFGVNYVEAAQTRDYGADPQEYGGFSTLASPARNEILAHIFGPQGLRPALIKMFLDPFHQDSPGAPYDHETTTRWTRFFAREGLARTRERGADLSIITALYGPPAWMTRQGFLRGRDLDPRRREDCAAYIIDWVRYLRQEEGLPVDFISLHNEGEDWMRWPPDGSGPGTPNHDYNLYWPPSQVADMLALMGPMLAEAGLQDVGLTPGETSNWYRFHHYGYADAIAEAPEALEHLGLITSHGFYSGSYARWYGDHRSVGIDILREKKPGLHAWVTSTSWSDMDVFFLNEIRNNIYSAKVNGIIPWAVIQRPGKWIGGDPNPGTAFRVDGSGSYTIEAGYYYYKQVCPVGQAGMRVAKVRCNDPQVGLIAFAGGDSGHPDAFVLLNMADDEAELDIAISGSDAAAFDAYRTSPNERCLALARQARDGAGGGLSYVAPPLSATTFVAAD